MKLKQCVSACLAALMTLSLTACGSSKEPTNLIEQDREEERIVGLFSPMEKSKPNAENVARTAMDLTIAMAEEKLGLTMAYETYTADTYQDKTYDDACLDRAHHNMDDIYLLNPDVLTTLGREGKLMDLSELDSARNLRDIVLAANTVDGKLVGIPQEVVAYGLFVNVDMFQKYDLSLPNTPDEFLECCRVFKENGIETPVGANRWWLETFAFAIGYAELYNGGNTEAQIAALNSGEAKYSDYMRPGFEFIKKLIDLGYVDAEKALVSEAIEAEGPDFCAGKTPIVMAYWGAANSETAYGKTDFDMQVIGFPSSYGQMPVMSMTGFSILAEAEHQEDALKMLEAMTSDEALRLFSETDRVISPSKNVKVDCVPALKPLNDRIEEGVYVLASNAGMSVEQWGNTCLIVRELLAGATVDECMEKFDELQNATAK